MKHSAQDAVARGLSYLESERYGPDPIRAYGKEWRRLARYCDERNGGLLDEAVVGRFLAETGIPGEPGTAYEKQRFRAAHALLDIAEAGRPAPTEFKPMLEAFLIDYLPDRRGCSGNTVASYRDAFVLMARASQVLAIKKKRVATGELDYLPLDAVGFILDSAGECCIRDLAMLSLLYDSGARVQELADARVRDVRLEPPRTIRLTGKGNKTRIVPVTAKVGSITSKYLRTVCRSDEESLFANYKGDPIGRAGIAYTLQKHVRCAHERHPESVPSKCHPHTLRHSKAMHMLEAGVNLVYIRDFLGHISVTTTERYARAGPDMKRKAIDTLRDRVGASVLYGDGEKDELTAWPRSIV